MKKKALTLFTALALALLMAAPALAAGFSDVKAGDYFAAPVNWAVNQEITKGVTDARFAPEEVCTRAQIITFLWRAAGNPPGATVEITDVSSDDYYYEAVMWAKDLDMFEGDAFKPADPCTRLAAVEFMWVAAKKPQAAAAKFGDVKSEAVNWAVAAGVTTGTAEGVFSPAESCTRGQIVTFLYRAFADEEQKAADEKAAADQTAADKEAADKSAEDDGIQTGVYEAAGGKTVSVIEVAATEDEGQYVEIFLHDTATAVPLKDNVAQDEELRLTFNGDTLTLEVLSTENFPAALAGEYKLTK